MRVVLQRVKEARVRIKNEFVGEISDGFVLLLAIKETDTEKEAGLLVEKILKLRLFSEDEKSVSFMEKNIQEKNGEILVVSQFTLYGDCRKGTRPSFSDSANSEKAEKLYDYFVDELKKTGLKIETGQFAAHMELELINDGPVTLILDF